MNNILLVVFTLFSMACFSQSITLHEVCGEDENACKDFKHIKNFRNEALKVSDDTIFELNEANVARVYEETENEFFPQLFFIIKSDLQNKLNEKVSEVIGKNLAIVLQGKVLNSVYVHGSPQGTVKIDLMIYPNNEQKNNQLIINIKSIPWVKMLLDQEDSSKSSETLMWIYYGLGILFIIIMTLILYAFLKQRRKNQVK